MTDIKKKISLIGAFGVGKTSLAKQFVYSMFSEAYHTTIGVKVDKKVVTVDDINVTLMIWDIQGEDFFLSVPVEYIKGSSGYLLVMDGTRPETLDVAVSLQETAQKATNNAPFICLVNKADLKEEWKIDLERLENLKKKGWKIEMTSAKTGEHVDRSFHDLAQMMID
jgi:small GTP-binding protein